MDKYEDEDSIRFLSLLDATTDRIFEECSEVMAAESSAMAVACDTEIVPQSLSDCQQQQNELYPELSLVSSNNLPPASPASNYHCNSRKRRKCSSTSDQHILEEPSSGVSVNEKTCTFIGWPQNFTSSTYEAGKPLKEFKAKDNFTFTKNFNQHQREGAFRSNIGSVGSSSNNVFGVAMLPPTIGNYGKCETENTDKFDNFSKEFHEAIARIDSLIPSLQKLLTGVQVGTDQKNAGNRELRNNLSSNSEDGKNDEGVAGEYAEHSVFVFRSENDHEVSREGRVPISCVSRKQTLRANKGGKLSTNVCRGPNGTLNQTVHFPSLRRASSRNISVTENFQGSRIIIYNPKQTRERAAGESKQFRFQSPVPSVGSSSFRRPNKISSIEKSDRKAGKSHAREKRTAHFSDSIHRNSSRSEMTLHNQISEESSSSSLYSSSGSSVKQSNYLSTDLYSSGSDETDSGYEKVRRSSSDTDYDTSSDYSSQDHDSDINPSSPSGSDWSQHQRDRKGKTAGMFSNFRKKLGMVFHHHHHHHHYHSDRGNEPDLGHIGLLQRLGKMFHRSEKKDRKRVKADKPRKPVDKSVVKKKQDAGHFGTLVDGLMRHVRHSKKPKKVKDEVDMLGSVRHKTKRKKNKLPWWPKKGGGGVKVPNKGKVKLRRLGTMTAKMILT